MSIQDSLFDVQPKPAEPFERDSCGVKVRADGKGDAWANIHRRMGPCFNMTDIDTCFGFISFGVNGNDRVFVEYQPDNYANRDRLIRNYAIVALFERKTSEWLLEHATVSCSLYLHICRTYAERQPQPPRFFYVIGGNGPPWLMRELNILTGDAMGDTTVQTAEPREFLRVWSVIGLAQLRSALASWITKDTP